MPAPSYQTTPDHLAAYRRHVRDWQLRLGLQDWDITVLHQPADDDSEICGRYAGDYDARLATITLGHHWGTRNPDEPGQIETVALEEILHLLLSDISSHASCRSFDEQEYRRDEHTAIHRLIEALLYHPARSQRLGPSPEESLAACGELL